MKRVSIPGKSVLNGTVFYVKHIFLYELSIYG